MKNFFLTIIVCVTFLPEFSWGQKTEPCDEPSYTTEGVLANTSSKYPIIKETVGTTPSVGDKGEMSKHFEESLFGGNVNGWMTIGVVEVTSVKNGQVTFKILEKKSVITVNGQTKNHFVAGKTVKFEQFDDKVSIEKIFEWENGNKKAEGSMLCGTKTGKWNYYYESGKLNYSETYDSNGEMDGAYTKFYESGQLKVKGSFKGEAKHGLFETYFENGNPEFYTEFDMDVRVGVYKEWYENGNMAQEGIYENGLSTGHWKIYEESGIIKREGNVNNGNEEGLWYYYDETGKLQEEATYKDGVMDGPYKFYHDNGKILREGNVIGEVAEGQWNYYYSDGVQHKTITWYNGKKQGPFTIWYENGNMMEKGTYDPDSNLDGDYESFYENGKPKEKGTYEFGEKVGKWFTWNEKGKKKVVRFKKNK